MGIVRVSGCDSLKAVSFLDSVTTSMALVRLIRICWLITYPRVYSFPHQFIRVQRGSHTASCVQFEGDPSR